MVSCARTEFLKSLQTNTHSVSCEQEAVKERGAFKNILDQIRRDLKGFAREVVQGSWCEGDRFSIEGGR